MPGSRRTTFLLHELASLHAAIRARSAAVRIAWSSPVMAICDAHLQVRALCPRSGSGASTGLWDSSAGLASGTADPNVRLVRARGGGGHAPLRPNRRVVAVPQGRLQHSVQYCPMGRSGGLSQRSREPRAARGSRRPGGERSARPSRPIAPERAAVRWTGGQEGGPGGAGGRRREIGSSRNRRK